MKALEGECKLFDDLDGVSTTASASGDEARGFSYRRLPQLYRLRRPPHLPEFCVADGDAPPERFGHVHTMPDEQVLCDTRPDFLRKRGLDPGQG